MIDASDSGIHDMPRRALQFISGLGLDSIDHSVLLISDLDLDGFVLAQLVHIHTHI